MIKGWWFIMLIIHKNPIFESRKLFVIWIYLELNTNLNHQLTIGWIQSYLQKRSSSGGFATTRITRPKISLQNEKQ